MGNRNGGGVYAMQASRKKKRDAGSVDLEIEGERAVGQRLGVASKTTEILTEK
jgi:hypothetical protein